MHASVRRTFGTSAPDSFSHAFFCIFRYLFSWTGVAPGPPTERTPAHLRPGCLTPSAGPFACLTERKPSAGSCAMCAPQCSPRLRLTPAIALRTEPALMRPNDLPAPDAPCEVGWSWRLGHCHRISRAERFVNIRTLSRFEPKHARHQPPLVIIACVCPRSAITSPLVSETMQSQSSIVALATKGQSIWGG